MTGSAAAARTMLFVPGTRADRYAKAVASAADLVVIDLEDAVADEDKAQARQNALSWLRGGGTAAVRVNAPSTPHYDADVAALAGARGLLAVVVPMADSVAALAAAHEQLGEGVEVVALVETAVGLLRAVDLASAPGVTRLAFGHLDFALDIGADTGPEAMLMARLSLVVASRAAGLPGPVDGVTTALDDPAAAREDAARARAFGFTGKLCIHPNQVAVVNEAMTPGEEEVAWARRVVESRLEGAMRVDGQMVDAPVVTRAENILSRARRNDDGRP